MATRKQSSLPIENTLIAPRINADQAIEHIEAARKYSISHKKRRRLQRAISLIIPHRQRLELDTDRESTERIRTDTL